MKNSSLRFSRRFQDYAAVNDTISTIADGFDIEARLEYDPDTHPSDFECYSPEDILSWENQEWFFVGVVLSVRYAGVLLDERIESSWGIECNTEAGNSYLTDIANEMLPSALDAGQKKLALLVKNAFESGVFDCLAVCPKANSMGL